MSEAGGGPSVAGGQGGKAQRSVERVDEPAHAPPTRVQHEELRVGVEPEVSRDGAVAVEEERERGAAETVTDELAHLRCLRVARRHRDDLNLGMRSRKLRDPGRLALAGRSERMEGEDERLPPCDEPREALHLGGRGHHGCGRRVRCDRRARRHRRGGATEPDEGCRREQADDQESDIRACVRHARRMPVRTLFVQFMSGQLSGRPETGLDLRYRGGMPDTVIRRFRPLDAAAVRAVIGESSELVQSKILSSLDTHCRSFIARSPFVLVATIGADGGADVSPRGDPAGFVHIVDGRTLAIPDRPGNKLIATLRNVVDTDVVGLLFLVPGVGETLRVNGRGYVTDDAELLASMEVNGRTPLVAIVVEIEEAFLHCAKAFIRSRLWDPAVQIDRKELPTLARMLHDQLALKDPVEELVAYVDDSYRTTLY